MMTHGLLSIETIPRPFLKNQTSLDQYPKVLHRLFLNVGQIEGYLNILKLSCKVHDFISYKAFLKIKKRSGTSLPASFSA